MTPEQQEVYGWLGLSPALLLETPPDSDNVLVRVVRPGEDAEAVLDEARQQLAASAGRRRRRGRRWPRFRSQWSTSRPPVLARLSRIQQQRWKSRSRKRR